MDLNGDIKLVPRSMIDVTDNVAAQALHNGLWFEAFPVCFLRFPPSKGQALSKSRPHVFVRFAQAGLGYSGCAALR